MQIKEPHVFKGGVYDFREDGKMLRWFEHDDEIDFMFEYDKLGRIIEKTTWTEGVMTKYKYGYKKWFYAEISERNERLVKTFFYVNKKLQIIEKKVFDKNPEDKSYILDNRIIYTYDKRDSLIGETHYNYFSRFGSKTVGKRWVTYNYHPKTGKRILEKHINDDKVVTYFVEYSYDEKGRPSFILGRGGDGEYNNSTKFIYKNGKIWQKIEISRTEGMTVTVYKNGIPIRERYYEKKEYDGIYDDNIKNYELFHIVNFQYVYYD